MESETATPPAPRGAEPRFSCRAARRAGVLAVVQLSFFTTWIVSVIYLGDLLDAAGPTRAFLPVIILADRIRFAFADAAMGAWADRIERGLRRLSPPPTLSATLQPHEHVLAPARHALIESRCSRCR